MDSKTNDLKKIRRKKQRHQFGKKLFTIFVIIALVFIAYITKEKWIPLFNGIIDKYKTTVVNDGKLASGNFPLKVGVSEEYTIMNVENNFAVLTDSHLTLYDKNGSQSSLDQHEMANPILKTSSKRALIYDLGGVNFSVKSKKKTIYSKELSDIIVYAQISDKGYAAVVTKSEKYASLMTIYDDNGKEIFNSSMNNKIIDIAFNSGSKGCIATTISAEGGQLVSKLLSFKFSKDKQEWESKAVPTLAVKTSIYSNNNIAVIGNSQYSTLSSNGEVQYTYEYKADLVGSSTGENITALVFYNSQRRKTSISIISENSKQTDIPINGKFKNVLVQNNKVYLMSDNQLVAYSSDGKVIATAILTKDYTDFTIMQDYAYLLGLSEVDRIDFKS